MPDLSDREILLLTRKMKKGTEQSWKTFHDCYAVRLATFIYSTTRDSDAISDILQEALCRAVRHIRTFDSETTFWCWLTCLARSAATDYFRKETTRNRALEALAEELFESSAPSIGWVSGLLNFLPEMQRILLRQKYLEGYTVKEMAQYHQLSPKRIEHALADARQDFKVILDQQTS